MSRQQLENYTSLPEDAKPVVLALSVLMNRINTLPDADRDDLFELLSEWRKVESHEESVSIQRAMEEILAQTPVSVRKMPLEATDPKKFPALSKWSDSVALRIKHYRLAAGMTQAELAEKSSLPQSHISRLENATHSASFKTLGKLAIALGIEVRNLDPCAE